MLMNINFHKQLDKIILKNQGSKPSVLLHSCCGPCSSSVLEYLTQHFEVTLLWYNPNVYPYEEYELRLSTLRELLEKTGLQDKVRILAELWRSEDYYTRIKGLEGEKEGGKRCTECFRLRLEETAKIAKEQGFDYFCTTLTVSRHKDAVRINLMAMEIGKELGIPWLPSDFKKRDGENRSVELSEKYGLYRQLYCGCIYSLQHREDVARQINK